jgi:hypothetical protein
MIAPALRANDAQGLRIAALDAKITTLRHAKRSRERA